MTHRRPLPLSSAIACLLFTVSAFGQAIVLDRGQSAYGLAYQHTFVRHHIGFDGSKVDLGHIMAYSIRPEASYGLTDRVTVDGDVTFSAAKYIGSMPHGRLDDDTFHATLQDFHLGVRANALTRPLFVTPFTRLTLPSHHYQLEGHTATGRGKVELTSGIYAGRDLAPSFPDAYFELMASHTFVERTTIESDSERLNRTNGSLEVGYYVTPSVTVSAYGTGVRTHGGWDLPRAFKNSEEIFEHDRFDKSKDIQFGGSVAYGFRNGVSVYAGYFKTVWARTAHALGGPTLGLTWSPRPSQTWLGRSRSHSPILVAMR
jgi:hypothetical protein